MSINDRKIKAIEQKWGKGCVLLNQQKGSDQP